MFLYIITSIYGNVATTWLICFVDVWMIKETDNLNKLIISATIPIWSSTLSSLLLISSTPLYSWSLTRFTRTPSCVAFSLPENYYHACKRKSWFAGQIEPDICVSLALGEYVVGAVDRQRFVLHPYLTLAQP